MRQKRGELKLSQENLATEALNDPTRKSEISRIENGKINPRERTIQRLNSVLKISEAEMATIRQSGLTPAALDDIGGLTRDELELLATRFEIEGARDHADAKLRVLLTEKAKDYRALRAEIDELKSLSPRLANMHAAAIDALDHFKVEEAEALLADAREIVTEQLREPLEMNAQIMEAQATAALLRGSADAAFTLYDAIANSFTPLAARIPITRRTTYAEKLYDHGVRFGGTGLAHSITLWTKARDACDAQSLDWDVPQNTLATALIAQARRTEGAESNALLDEAISAYRADLQVNTREDHPVD